MTALLRVDQLSIAYDGTPVVREVSLSLDRGEVLGVVGESGSGKTSLGMGILRLLPSNGHMSGAVSFDGHDLLHVSPAALRRLRVDQLSVIMQNPGNALDPSLTVGAQFIEILRLRKRMPRKAAWAAGVEWLRRVGIPAPEQRMKAYPHELSGGMSQRVMVAFALSRNPSLLVADEPTSALDVTIQAQILTLLRSLIADFAGAVLIITHDFGIVAQLCNRVCVMHDGRIVEHGTVRDVLTSPQHDYTRHLLSCLPGRDRDDVRTVDR